MMNALCHTLILMLLVPYSSAEPLVIATTVIEERGPHFATFQSHNQKVVQNKRGIFMTYNHSRDEKYNAQEWRVMHSADGGGSFTQVFASTDATNPPCLETDSADNLYVGHPDWVTSDVVLVRLLASENYQTAHRTRVPKSAAGKYSLVLDEPRKQVCYFSHSGKFIRFGLDGKVLADGLLLKRGEKAVQEYTHLHVAADGVLHAAWTSLNVPIRRYWGIHHLQSPDGGKTWHRFAAGPFTPPIAADETGPSDRITLEDEFEPSTWLSNTLTKNGKTHFIYASKADKDIRQHHVRYDTSTGKREADHTPELKGETLALNVGDGFMATSTRVKDSPLFIVARTWKAPPRLACLRSSDNGQTWHDHAVSAPLTQPYAIGGCREITADGFVIGSFTDVTAEKHPQGGLVGRVQFFSIPVR
jgi:hypothetical protein